MGIYLGDKQGIAYKGGYKPVNIYHGSKKAAGWELSEKTGTELPWDDTYNDKVLSAVVEGESEQVVTVQGTNLYADGNASGIKNYSLLLKHPLPVGTYTISAVVTSADTDATTSLVFFLNASRVAMFNKPLTRGARSSAVFTISEPCVRLVFYASNTAANSTDDAFTFSDIQLELGSTATAYEPFVPNSPSPDYPSPIVSIGDPSGIDFAVTGYAAQTYSAHRDVILRSLPDGTHDTYDAVTGQIARRVGFKVFDGTEYILEHGTIAGWFYYTLSGGNADGNAIPQSTHFKGAVYNVNSLPDISVCMGGPTPNRIIFRYLTHSGSISSFKAYLAAQYAAGTPVTIFYKLAAPIIEHIDPIPLPTYPRYTTLNCSEQMTAKVRAVDIC